MLVRQSEEGATGTHDYLHTLQDKINAFWEITKKELDDRKAELRNKDREMEEMEERHQVEVKVNHQSMHEDHGHKIHFWPPNSLGLQTKGQALAVRAPEQYHNIEG